MSDNDDLVLVGDLDQSLPMGDDDVDRVAEIIDKKIKESIEQKNVYIGMNVAKQLIVAGQLVGWGLARILYHLEASWNVFEIDQGFKEFAYEYLGKHVHTVERYVKVEKMFADGAVPEEFEGDLRQHSIREVVPIAHAVDQGYEISNKQWKKLVNAPDLATISKIVRDEVKSVPPRPTALQLYIDREGSLWAFQAEHRYFVGSLDINSNEKTIQQAVQRIINNSGIMKQ